ncbi:4-hydroxy-tetrahydrodipicolinate synthase [Candidatus Woesearchaeota archaeon]|nr:4-hydroxy-tetrahydrodipicolinate synthase [Candidatus Woesearchaeota archaeon]
MTLPRLKPGAYTAIVTPRNANNSIDYRRLHSFVEEQITADITGLVVMGTTGEGDYIADFNAKSYARFAHYSRIINAVGEQRDAMKSEIPLIVGIKGQQASEAIRRSNIALDYGADAGLLVTPPYGKPRQNGLIAYFEKVAAESQLPFVLYDVQGRTGVSLEPETVGHLAQIPNIIGLKAATADMKRIKAYVDAAGVANKTRAQPFYVFSGDDATTYQAIQQGAKGGIAVVSNIIPREWTEMVTNALTNNSQAETLAADWKPLCDATMAYGNPMSTKAILEILGRGVGLAHPELGSLEPDEKADLERRLSDYPELKR